MNQFEVEECRAELDRLAERRRAAFEELEAVTKEMVIWIHRSRDAGMSMIEIGQHLHISRQRVFYYLKSRRSPQPRSSVE